MLPTHPGPADLTLTGPGRPGFAVAANSGPPPRAATMTSQRPNHGQRPTAAGAPSPMRLTRRPTVLVVTREDDTREQLLSTLGRAGCSVNSVATMRSAHREFDENRPDLVVLDLDLPDSTGWEMLTRIRSLSWLPLLVQSAIAREADKVRALQLGADDYVVKPVGNSELAARVLALLRRAGKIDRPATLGTHSIGDIEIDPLAREVHKAGTLVDLTPTEFRLLVSLVSEPGRLRSTRELLEAAWGDPWGVGGSRVKYAILRLRKKLDLVGGQTVVIENRRGFGYRLVVGADADGMVAGMVAGDTDGMVAGDTDGGLTGDDYASDASPRHTATAPRPHASRPDDELGFDPRSFGAH